MVKSGLTDALHFILRIKVRLVLDDIYSLPNSYNYSANKKLTTTTRPKT